MFLLAERLICIPEANEGSAKQTPSPAGCRWPLSAHKLAYARESTWTSAAGQSVVAAACAPTLPGMVGLIVRQDNNMLTLKWKQQSSLPDAGGTTFFWSLLATQQAPDLCVCVCLVVFIKHQASLFRVTTKRKATTALVRPQRPASASRLSVMHYHHRPSNLLMLSEWRPIVVVVMAQRRR